MKAQVTIFIIIGFVMLIAVGITLYATSFIVSKTKIIKTNVNVFVESCLKQSAEKAFFDLGVNGGYFKDEELRETVVSNDGEKFSVLIKRPVDDVYSGGEIVYFANPPNYPWPSFPYTTDKKESFVGYFGVSLLPPLEKEYPGSIQEKLENKTRDYLFACVNEFEELKNQGVDVKYGIPEVTFVFTNFSHVYQEKFTNIKLSWSLNETFADTKTKHKTFSVKLPVRFSTIHYYLEHVINKDISDISYAPEVPESMTINTDYYSDFSTITLEDPLSRIYGDSFKFTFAREDRRPALWDFEMPKTFHVGTKMSIIGDKELVINDPCGDNARILLKASDADERDVDFFVNDRSDIQFRNPGTFDLKISGSDRILEDFKIIRISVAVCT